MPNWCNNDLHIIGPKEELKRFDEHFKKEHNVVNKITKDGKGILKQTMEKGYSFENFIPMPVEELNNWYEWSIKNWGTKWDLDPNGVGASFYEDDAHKLYEQYYCFSTAWSPCVLAVQEMSKQFPDLDITHRYYEEGVLFAGEVSFSKGEIVEESFLDGSKVGIKSFRKYLEDIIGNEYTNECPECGCSIEECEIEDDDFECPNCDEILIYNDDLNVVELKKG
jgi:hypothetical protein